MGTEHRAEVLKSGVYRIDLGGGWFYVGSAKNLVKRESQHRSDLRRGVHCNQIMQRAYDKYGQFSLSVLERYPVDEILQREQELLDANISDPNCANISPTAANCLGVKHTDETRSRMSAAWMGHSVSSNTRAKISATNTGYKHTDATRANMSAAQIGRTHSDDTKAKIGISKLGKKRPPRTPEHRAAHSAALTGYKHTDKARANMSAAQKGRKRAPLTDAHRANMSVAQYARQARIREAALAAL